MIGTQGPGRRQVRVYHRMNHLQAFHLPAPKTRHFSQLGGTGVPPVFGLPDDGDKWGAVQGQ